MEMRDPLDRVADVLRNVAVHDLQVIEIADELDVLRVDALADADTPSPTAERLVRAAERRIQAPVVHVLDRDRHAAILELAFDAIQKRDGIVGGLLVRHAAPLTADRDDGLRTLI